MSPGGTAGEGKGVHWSAGLPVPAMGWAGWSSRAERPDRARRGRLASEARAGTVSLRAKLHGCKLRSCLMMTLTMAMRRGKLKVRTKSR